MNSTIPLRLLWCVVCAAALAGCPGNSDPMVDSGVPGMDASPDTGVDGSVVGMDVPTGNDTGVEVDAPAPADGGAADTGPGSDGGARSDAGTDAGAADAPVGCGDPASRPTVIVSADITADTTWTCNNIYEIDQIRYVTGGAGSIVTLMIEPGTLIRGEPAVRDGAGAIVELPGTLVVTRSGRLIAEGTEAAPIVFTSAAADGVRRAGDWGGVVLLGRGVHNYPTPEVRMEGLPLSAGMRGFFGVPTGMTADPAWSCGSLRYVRIEFAGFELADAKELNSLTLGACGTGTRLSYVQAHMGLDDGFEFFGGAPDADHLVITGAQDDSLDWDNGFRGRLQFVVAQQYPMAITMGTNPDRGIEANNNTEPAAEPATATPVSEPRIFNMTLISTGLGGSTSGAGIVFRDGTYGYVSNTLITGFAGGAFDVDDADTISAALSMGGLDRLVFRNGIVEQSVLAPPSGTFWTSDTDGIVESSHFTAAALMNRETSTGTPPTVLPAPFDIANPGWVPAAGSAADSGAEVPGEAPDTSCAPTCATGEVCRFGVCQTAFFDPTATFVGAFEPGAAATSDWTLGWTSLDLN